MFGLGRNTHIPTSSFPAGFRICSRVQEVSSEFGNFANVSDEALAAVDGSDHDTHDRQVGVAAMA